MKNILITREEKLDNKLEKIAKEKDLNIIYCPLIKTTKIEFNPPDLDKYDYLIITSKNAVKYFLKSTPLEKILHKKVIAVGEKTKKYLKNLGFNEIITPEISSAVGVEKLIQGKQFKDKKFLFIRAEKGQEIKNKNLDLLIVYKTIFNKPENYKECSKLLIKGKIDYVIFSSPSTFYSFMENFKNCEKLLNNTKIITIGNTTKKAVESKGFNVYFVPKKPSFEEIINAL